MSGLSILFAQLIELLTIQNIILLCAGSSLGIVFGALPGLTAAMGIAILTGLTYGIEPSSAIIVLMGIYVGAIYGGSISSILVGIPGTPAAAATVLDGHPLALRGEGKRALSFATIASFLGTLFGMICLTVFTPLLQRVALDFQSPEYFLLAVFGVLICGSLTSPDIPLKGWIAGFIGLAASCVGLEGMHCYERYTFGNVSLMAGLSFIPAMIGLFGLPSIISILSQAQEKKIIEVGKGRGESLLKMLRGHIRHIFRSGCIGTFIGTVPGVGEDIAAWMSYDVAKRISKHPEKFGTGCYEGVVAAEVANNAAIGGSLIPVLSLAIPGSAPAAVLLGALMLHGIRPGPMLSFEFPHFVYEMSAILLLAAFTTRIFGLLACQVAVLVLKIPFFIFMPMISVICIIGSYALEINIYHLYVMFTFGILGYFLFIMKYPPAPMVLGMILGPLADTNFRRTLFIYNGSLDPFFSRPIAFVVDLMILYTILSQFGLFSKCYLVIKSYSAKMKSKMAKRKKK